LFANPGFSENTIRPSTAAALTLVQDRLGSPSQRPAEKVNENRCNVNEGFAEKSTRDGVWNNEYAQSEDKNLQKLAILQEHHKKNKYKRHMFGQQYSKCIARTAKNAIFRLTSEKILLIFELIQRNFRAQAQSGPL
jgi:hypothetical protein